MFSAGDNGYQHDANVKYFGDGCVADSKSSHAAHENDISVQEFGLQRRRREPPLSQGMSSVMAMSAPFKIGDHIIRLHGINVIDDWKPVWVGNERHGHKSVDIEGSVFSSDSSKDKPSVSATLLNARRHEPSYAALHPSVNVDDVSRDASHASETADFVAPFVTNDGSPFFNDDGIHVTGCPSGNGGLAIKDPSHASTFGGSGHYGLGLSYLQ
jgi:hypothetical protein